MLARFPGRAPRRSRSPSRGSRWPTMSIGSTPFARWCRRCGSTPTAAGPSTRPSRPPAALTADGPLEYIEQPCETVPELAELRRRVDVPIAADESIRKADDPLHVVRADAADIAVLKVAPLGGVRKLLEIAEQIDIPIVVSSALDSAVGIASGTAGRRCAARPGARLRAGHRRAVRGGRCRTGGPGRRLPARQARGAGPGPARGAGRPARPPAVVDRPRHGLLPADVLICGGHGLDAMAAVANTESVRSVVVLGYPGVQALDLVGPFEVFTGATHLPGQPRPRRRGLRRQRRLAERRARHHRHRPRACRRNRCPTRVNPSTRWSCPAACGVDAGAAQPGHDRLDPDRGRAHPSRRQRLHRFVPRRAGRPARRLRRDHALGVRRPDGT